MLPRSAESVSDEYRTHPPQQLNYGSALLPFPPKNNVEATKEVFGGGPKNFLGVAKLFFFNIVLGGAGGARSLDFHS